MISKLVFLSLVALSLNISSSYAASTHLTEYEWGNPAIEDASKENKPTLVNPSAFSWDGTDSNAKTTNDVCSTQCTGFTKNNTSCDDGYSLVTCEASGCSEYSKCEENGCAPGFDKEFKDCAIDVQEDNYQCSKCVQ